MYQYELETNLDREFQSEFETGVGEDREYESEEFFPLLAPLLGTVAPMAIKAIGGLLGRRRRRRQSEFEFESPQGEYEAEYQGEYEGDPFIGKLLQGLGSMAGMNESEYEFEQFEPIPASESEVLAEHLAHMAANSESEAEAEAFIGALVPLIARGFGAAAPSLMRAAPHLIRGAARAAHTLYPNARTRPLLRTFPGILKKTASMLARQANSNRPLAQSTAVKALAGNVAQVLGNPRTTAQIMKRSRLLHANKCPYCNSGRRGV